VGRWGKERSTIQGYLTGPDVLSYNQ